MGKSRIQSTLSERGKQCLGRDVDAPHEMRNCRCVHCGEAEQTIRNRHRARCKVSRECKERGPHTVHKRANGRVLTAQDLTVPMPGVDLREQCDLAAPKMSDGPPLYIWGFPIALHLSLSPGTRASEMPEITIALCNEASELRPKYDRKRSAPLDKICGACRAEASKMKGVIR